MSFALVFVPIVLLLLGFPIFLVLLTSVTVAIVFFLQIPAIVLHQHLFGSLNAFALLAVPFFIYAGELMGRGSVANVSLILCKLAQAPSAAHWVSPLLAQPQFLAPFPVSALQQSQPSAR